MMMCLIECHYALKAPNELSCTKRAISIAMLCIGFAVVDKKNGEKKKGEIGSIYVECTVAKPCQTFFFFKFIGKHLTIGYYEQIETFVIETEDKNSF